MIDWQAVCDLLFERLGLSSRPLRARQLGGGDINQAFLLEDGRQRFFIKLNRAAMLPMFEAESLGLAAIRNSGCIRLPEVYLVASHGEHAFMAMEYIDFGARGDNARLGRQLAAMHACSRSEFGFSGDNFIGSNPQPNTPSGDWVEFWQTNRLGYQLSLGEGNGFDAGLLRQGRRLNQQVGLFFRDYQPRPALLHGDLWSGNHASDGEGNPVIYDPACYFGDHEADLAMLELFGDPGDAFFAAYHEIYPIDAGYPLRRDLYNLYHLLNHANLFAGGYLSRSRVMIDSLLARLGC